MSKIILSNPNNDYSCEIDTGVMDVELREVFTGVQFITEDDERLSVCMRDSGFEVVYTGNFQKIGLAFKQGIISGKGGLNERN